MPVRHRFVGRIAGVGSNSGVRLVVGRWDAGPWGPFADVMVATATGHRVLLAPDERVAAFVAATYSFDEVRIEPVAVADSGPGPGDGWSVRTASLALDLELGGRTPLGVLLRAVPPPLARAPWFCAVTDPVARVALRGVRTRGSAGNGRREYYGAGDVRSIVAARGRFDGVDLGGLAPVDPPPDFGFSSTPRRPCVTAVTTTIVEGG
ncbi:hypothetical protein GCM10022215_30990 [Nocardioides fonticola]|uniref:Uncharacterized protein n=1 Tax=Nocardioides fonticola TaxID=450363 RepID=A0ABP7XR10_9ACTN